MKKVLLVIPILFVTCLAFAEPKPVYIQNKSANAELVKDAVESNAI
jgi:hypothetical protein